jgi:hypothetical protein
MPKPMMLSTIPSTPRVRWRSRTNTPGLPRYRLPLMPSQNASSHVPAHHFGVGRVPHACAKRAWKGPLHPSGMPSGPGPPLSRSGTRAPHIRPLAEPSHANGPSPLAVLAGSNALRGIGLSQRLATPGGTPPSQLGTWIVKKSFNALDSPPQGVCSASACTGSPLSFPSVRHGKLWISIRPLLSTSSRYDAPADFTADVLNRLNLCTDH